MSNLRKIFQVFVAVFFLAACAREMSSDVYTSGSESGKVLEGKIVSARPITIKEADRLQNNSTGVLGGGLAGGLAGSSAGGGSGKTLAAIGGAIVGATAGAVMQDKLGTSKGMEYVVRIDKKYLKDVYERKTLNRRMYGVSTAEEDLNQSISVADTKTDLISVVQGMDITFQAGQRVLIIYHNDRPRLAPAG